MCLSIPSKVVKVSDDNTMCTVDTMGVQRDANLMMMEDDDVQVGDYVLLHIGFVMNKIDEKEALASIETYREILEVMDEQERRQAILEDDECPNRGSSANG
ncbi:MAG: HypC/HybG/HupF family hydrogenase formation chaperone [Sulfurovum sp.]|nr:HypC/HybG/HupF family hydrogenase formation chaperone [Sulfurovum sp.]